MFPQKIDRTEAVIHNTEGRHHLPSPQPYDMCSFYTPKFQALRPPFWYTVDPCWPERRGDLHADTDSYRQNGITGFLLIPVSRNGFQQMPHFQLIRIGLDRCFHPPFLIIHSSNGVIHGDNPKIVATSLPPTV